MAVLIILVSDFILTTVGRRVAWIFKIYLEGKTQ
jgi:hypothetical protein